MRILCKRMRAMRVYANFASVRKKNNERESERENVSERKGGKNDEGKMQNI